MKFYTSPDEAIRDGMDQRAIGEIMVEDPYVGKRRMWVIYTKHKTPFLAYPGTPGIKVRDATAKEVDQAKRWRNMMNDGRWGY
jgi:hypothetical protein